MLRCNLLEIRLVAVFLLVIGGCAGPEDGRLRSGGAGGDGGNYRSKPVHAPSKIDGSKNLAEIARL